MSQSQFEILFKNNPLPGHCWKKLNNHFTLTDINDAAISKDPEGEKIRDLGKTPEEMYADQPSMIINFKNCLKEAKTISSEEYFPARSLGQGEYFNVTYIFINADLIVVQSEDISSKRELTTDSKKREKTFLALDKSNQVILAIISLNKIEYINHQAENLSGYSLKEIYGMDFIQLIHPGSRDFVNTRFQARMTGIEENEKFEVALLTKNGETRWIDMSLLVTEYSGIKSMVCIILDITNKKQADSELFETRSRLNNIHESINDGLFILNRNWEYKYLNNRAAKMINRKAENLIGKNIWEEFPELVNSKFYQAYHKTMKDREEITVVDYFEPMDKWFSTKVYPNQEGISVLHQDLTDQKKGEIALRKNANYLKTIFNNTMIAIFVADDQGNYLDANESASKLLDISVEEIKKMNIVDLGVKGFDHTERKYSGMMNMGIESSEFHFSNFQGKEKIVMYQATRIEKDFNVSVLVDVTPLRDSEEALTLSIDRNQAILDAIPDLLFLISEDGIFLDYNATDKQQLRFQPDEFLGKSILDIFPAEEGIIHFSQVKKAIESGKLVTYEYKVDNKLVNRYFEGRLVPAKNGKEVIIIVRDITIRKQSELEILNTKEKLNNILESIDDGFFTLDQKWQFTFLNQNAIKIYNTRAEDLLGKNIWEEYPHLIDSKFYFAYQKTMKEKIVVNETDYIKSLDKWFNVKAYPSLEGISVLYHDITQSMLSIKNLEKNELVLKEAEHIANLGRWEWDNENNMFTGSEEGLHIFGLPPGTNIPFTELILKVHKDDREFVENTMDESIKNRRNCSIEFRILRPNGKVRFVHVRAKVSYKRGQSVKMVGTIQDITEQVNNKEALRVSYDKLKKLEIVLESDREDEKKRIAMWLHDELGQELGASKLQVYSVIEKLNSSSLKSEAENDIIRKLYNVNYGLSRSIVNLRNISHELSPLILDKLGLEAALEFLLEAFKQNHKIEIRSQFELNNTLVDNELSLNLYRILQESLNNISKHARATKVSLFLFREEDLLRMEIHDNGIGMDLNKNNNKNNKDQSGMGFLNIQERIKLWNGNLKIKSVKNKGTILIITIPLK